MWSSLNYIHVPSGASRPAFKASQPFVVFFLTQSSTRQRAAVPGKHDSFQSHSVSYPYIYLVSLCSLQFHRGADAKKKTREEKNLRKRKRKKKEVLPGWIDVIQTALRLPGVWGGRQQDYKPGEERKARKKKTRGKICMENRNAALFGRDVNSTPVSTKLLNNQ